MEVSPTGIKLIKQSEGLRLESYVDEAGVWTIGYGTKARANYPYSIDSLEAERLLKTDLKRVSDALTSMLIKVVAQHEFDALADWAYNIGTHAAKTSTLIKKLNFGEPDLEVASEFLRWRFVTLPDGTKVPKKGLLRRRERERNLYLTGSLIW